MHVHPSWVEAKLPMLISPFWVAAFAKTCVQGQSATTVTGQGKKARQH